MNNRYCVRLAASALFILTTMTVMAVEEAEFSVVFADEPYELRDYAPQVLAEVIVGGELEEAGGDAFSLLFGYISGKNRAREKIAMTAPVGQQRRGEKIPMTAPAVQQPRADDWAVSFMMPRDRDLASLPKPENERISLRAVPARRMAVVRYSGTWSEARYERHKTALETWMSDNGFKPDGPPLWARYNAPFVPWFMRRNEIQIPVLSTTKPDTARAP